MFHCKLYNPTPPPPPLKKTLTLPLFVLPSLYLPQHTVDVFYLSAHRLLSLTNKNFLYTCTGLKHYSCFHSFALALYPSVSALNNKTTFSELIKAFDHDYFVNLKSIFYG